MPSRSASGCCWSWSSRRGPVLDPTHVGDPMDPCSGTRCRRSRRGARKTRAGPVAVGEARGGGGPSPRGTPDRSEPCTAPQQPGPAPGVTGQARGGYGPIPRSDANPSRLRPGDRRPRDDPLGLPRGEVAGWPEGRRIRDPCQSAESGEFDAAVEWRTRAIEWLGDERNSGDDRSRLAPPGREARSRGVLRTLVNRGTSVKRREK